MLPDDNYRNHSKFVQLYSNNESTDVITALLLLNRHQSNTE